MSRLGCVFTLVTLLVCSPAAIAGFPGWYPQSNPTATTLNDIHALDVNTAFAVGANGTIIKTIDGGEHWTALASSATASLNSVYFLDGGRGWAAGANTIVETNDGGNSWTSRIVDANIKAIAFPTSLIGVAAGGTQGFLQTIDGGATWANISGGSGYNLPQDLFFLDAQRGWASGWKHDGVIREGCDAWGNCYIEYLNPGSRIWRTVDGGASWTNVTLASCPWLGGVSFIDANTGWVVGASGFVAKTTDGGVTWHEQTSGTTYTLWSVDFADVLNGWATGEYGVILHTTDGGETWISQVSGTGSKLVAVDFATVTNGWTVGDVILRTDNSGVRAPAPSISSIDPGFGPATLSTDVRIFGSGFLDGAKVYFGGWSASTVTFVSSTELTATTSGGTGVDDVQLYNPDGQSATLPSAFTYIPPPYVVSVVPASGPSAGGTLVTISGSNFVSGAIASFGNSPATHVTFVDASTLTARTPQHAAGTVSVAVRNPDGQTEGLPGAYTYEPGLMFLPETLSDGNAADNYRAQFSATGGTEPYTFAVTSGTLPEGLTLSATGLLSGTPSIAGVSTFTITVTDSSSKTAARGYTLRVCNSIALAPTILATGYLGVPYSQAITYIGGSPPVTFAITPGSLPSGLTFENNVISGVPAEAGSTSLTLTATDAIGCTASLDWTLTIETGAAARELRAWPVSSSSISLAWTDPQMSETGFRIERSNDGASWQPVHAAGTDDVTYTDAGLSAATLYYYRVIALISGSDAPPSNVTAATTFASTAMKLCATQFEADHTSASWSSVAFNGTQWAVAYQESDGIDSDIYFRLLDRTTGNPAGAPVRITSTDAQSRYPTLRWNGANFGLVWNEFMRGPAGESTSRIMFALLDAGGNKIRGNVPINNEAMRGFISRDGVCPLVWDGAGWGVFAEEAVTEPADLVYYHLDSDGDVLHGPVTIAASPDWDGNPSAAWNGSEHGIAWTRDAEETVWFQRMHPDGTLIGSPVKVFENTFKMLSGIGMTGVASNGSGWAVAWAFAPSEAEYFVSMRLIDSAGNLLGTAASQLSDDSDLNGYTAADRKPTDDDLPIIMLKPGGGYLVYTWSWLNRTGRAEVGRLEADASGKRVGTRIVVSANDGFTSRYHRVATDGTNHLVVYNDSAQGLPEIGRALVAPDGTYVAGPAKLTSGHALPGAPGSTTVPLGEGFAALWMEPATISASVPHARIWDAMGTEVASKAPLTTKNPLARPAVVPFGDSFAIAYKERTTNDVIFASFDGAGSQIGSDVVVQAAEGSAAATAISFNGESFSVAWIESNRVRFRRVSTDGMLLGSRVSLATTALSGGPLLMQWAGTGWAIVWRSPVDSEFWYGLLDGTGATLVSPIQLTSSTGSSSPSDAQLAWSGSKLALVWTQYASSFSPGQDIWYTIFGLDGLKGFPEKVLTSTAWNDNGPSLTWQGDGFHVVYAAGTGTLREISFASDGTVQAASRILSNRGGASSTAWNGATLGITWMLLGHLFFETSACFDDVTAPPCPAATGSFGAAGITLSWPAVTDAESGLFRYNVYRDGWMLAENFPSTRTLLDGGYTANATHFYEVRAMDAALRESSDCATVPVFASTFPCGDVNGDNTVSPPDVIYLIDFLFAGGSAPGRGDVDGDGQTNVGDIFSLINYLFASGGAPDCT